MTHLELAFNFLKYIYGESELLKKEKKEIVAFS